MPHSGRLADIPVYHILLILAVIHSCAAYNYLFLAAQASSHMSEQVFVGEALIARGHTVYMGVAESFPWKSRTESVGIKLLKYRGQGTTYSSVFHTSNYSEKLQETKENNDHLWAMLILGDYTSRIVYEDCTAMISDQKFLEDVSVLKFDMMLIDGFVLSTCNAILPYHLGIPFVSMYVSYIHAGRLPLLPSFMSNSLHMKSDRMTFLERVESLLMAILERYFIHIPFSGAKNTSLLERYPNPDGHHASSWYEVVSKSELFIMTRDHTLDWPMVSMPHYVLLPGITQQPAKPLPPDLESHMSLAQNVVLVSFGSIANGFNKDGNAKLLFAFEQNPDLLFIWKVSKREKEDKSYVPRNVITLTWLPQNDILGHPKLKLFITHCGNNGQYESVYHGVPMIGLPQFAEQFRNCHRMHAKGYGICMDSYSFTGQELADNIKTIFDDSWFSTKTQRMSYILKEDDLPMNKAAHWIEHVTKHGGEHLRSSSVDMPLYQYWMLDVLGFLVLLTTLPITLLVYCVTRFLKRICTQKLKSE